MMLSTIKHGILSIVAPLWYFGNKFFCPVCPGRFSKFLFFNGRPQAKCPRCGALERHRLLWLYLMNKTSFFQNNITVLDIGPSRWFQGKCKKMKNIKYVSIDIASSLATIKADIIHMPFCDNVFDCIICYRVLEFINDDKKAMAELFRLLRPGGWAILQSLLDNSKEVTFEPENPGQFFPRNDPVKRIYGRDYQKKLEVAGFKVKPDAFVMEYGDDFIKRHGLAGNEIVYYCTKSSNE